MRIDTPEIRWHCNLHGINEAILSVDFLQKIENNNNYSNNYSTIQEIKDNNSITYDTIATGGADKEVKLWKVVKSDQINDSIDNIIENKKENQNKVKLEFIYSLVGHERTVNCVRFAPNGESLASSSDDSCIIIWARPKTANINEWKWENITSENDFIKLILNCGHNGDITDLAWSPDSHYLGSVSVDNRLTVWSVPKGKMIDFKNDHIQFVQGIAWDPLQEYVCTQSNDRTARIYTLEGFESTISNTNITLKNNKSINMKINESEGSKNLKKKRTKKPRKLQMYQLLKSRYILNPSNDQMDNKMNNRKVILNNLDRNKEKGKEKEENSNQIEKLPKHHLFHDDTFPSYSRRLSWTPDGMYLLCPAGLYKDKKEDDPINSTYAFSRGNLAEPSFVFPGSRNPSLCVRCSPILYKLRNSSHLVNESKINEIEMNALALPYRIIFAVITTDAILIYDSQHHCPIYTISDLHYATLTDASWSRDGKTLVVSSLDGYCSVIYFSSTEFGIALSDEEIPMSIRLLQKFNSNFSMFSFSQEKKSDFVKKEDQIIKDDKENICVNDSPIDDQCEKEPNINILKPRSTKK